MNPHVKEQWLGSVHSYLINVFSSFELLILVDLNAYNVRVFKSSMPGTFRGIETQAIYYSGCLTFLRMNVREYLDFFLETK